MTARTPGDGSLTRSVEVAGSEPGNGTEVGINAKTGWLRAFSGAGDGGSASGIDPARVDEPDVRETPRSTAGGDEGDDDGVALDDGDGDWKKLWNMLNPRSESEFCTVVFPPASDAGCC